MCVCGIFNSRLLFKNNRLLFSGTFYGGDKALMEGDKVVMGGGGTKENPDLYIKGCILKFHQMKTDTVNVIFENLNF